MLKMAEFRVDVNENVLKCFVFWAGVVLFKTLFMSLFTTINRISKKVFATPEDYVLVGKEASVTTDPYIERIRSCHRNDLENIPVFILIGSLYLLVVPDTQWACVYFRIFGVTRLIHTFVYLAKVRQPARVLSFIIGYSVNMLMALTVIGSVYSHF